MNKTAIKNFAIEARKSLIAMAVSRAGILGITADNISTASQSGHDFEVYPTHFGTETTLTGKEVQSRGRLIGEIKAKGFEQVMEEVAYTWFNRLIAIRFMEVNDYLPSRVRVLSSETAGKMEPDLVTQAPHDVEMDFTTAEIDAIYAMKDDSRRSGELFRTLFIKQCNLLGDILPQLFEKTADYTELLLDIAWDKEDGVVRQLLTIDEGDFLEAVEIVGWMYQYYNTEPKETVFANLKKNIKISKENIPAATQLFTPDWIVRYMVENSLGRIFVDNRKNEGVFGDGRGRDEMTWQEVESKRISNEKFIAEDMGWKYYLPEAEQSPEMESQLNALKHDADLKMEGLKVIDPCMGSGHILVYAFDVLMQIYEHRGYTSRDAVSSILLNNLYGLDIDQRAYQMAYFAVMMKARSYDRRFLTRNIPPQIYCPTGYPDGEEFGSLLTVDQLEPMPEEPEELTLFNQNYDVQLNTWNFRRLLAQKYDVVVTNPPYMGSSGMSGKLSDFVKKEYPDSKSDLFACFIEHGLEMAKPNAYSALIVQPSVLFLSSFEKLRQHMLRNTISSLLHMGRGIFGIDFGSTAFVLRKSNIPQFVSPYFRLHERTFQYIDHNDIEKLFLMSKGDMSVKFNFSEYDTKNDDVTESEKASSKSQQLYFEAQQENFSKIPGSPIAYWVSEGMLDNFNNNASVGDIAQVKIGMGTGKNEVFVRNWWEVITSLIEFTLNDTNELESCAAKWFPYNKGGDFRLWYGNLNEVLWFDKTGRDTMNSMSGHRENGGMSHYFKKGITWSFISSSKFGVRCRPNGSLFDVAGSTMFTDMANYNYLLALLSSNVANYVLNILNPTLNYQAGNVKSIPVIIAEKETVDTMAEQNISISRTDWDSFETSWDFQRHPLAPSAMAKKEQMDSQFATTRMEKFSQLAWHFEHWNADCTNRFNQLKANEEELNRIFIDIYGLQDELTPEVEDKDVTVRKADLTREVKSLISYAVGCMFGRYSLDVDGLAYAGGDWDASKYTTFIPDADNVLPITDTGYFEDDIVTRLVEFVRVVYGADTLEENLDFIAAALGNKGATSREVIRNYFLKDFYKDHVKTYQKRPIYWLFDSGKQDGFKALVYLHRYDADTSGRVRTDYLHKQQGFLESAIERCDYTLLQESANPRDKATATKEKDKLIKQLAETRTYDQALAHIALQRIPLDLDDGVKVNYAKFQGIEVAREGQKTVKIDLLGKI